MPFVQGGELYQVYQKEKRFNEETVLFYTAQIVMAIGYLHTKDIVHRDLKLENILLDNTGYLKIIDYGLAKMLKEQEQTQSFCGTPEYLAPEMVTYEGHDKNVDWWAIGVLIYEMLIGVTPFFNPNRNMLMKKITAAKVVFPDRKKYKIEYSDDIMDLIKKLLQKDRTKRLGFKNDAEEILSHKAFANINMKDLLIHNIDPPYTPESNKDGDFTKFYNVEQSGKAISDTYIPRENRKLVKENSDMFQNFDSKKKK